MFLCQNSRILLWISYTMLICKKVVKNLVLWNRDGTDFFLISISRFIINHLLRWNIKDHLILQNFEIRIFVNLSLGYDKFWRCKKLSQINTRYKNETYKQLVKWDFINNFWEFFSLNFFDPYERARWEDHRNRSSRSQNLILDF